MGIPYWASLKTTVSPFLLLHGHDIKYQRIAINIQSVLEMTITNNNPDARPSQAIQPPLYLKKVYKRYQLMKDDELGHDDEMADFGLQFRSGPGMGWQEIGTVSCQRVREMCNTFDGPDGDEHAQVRDGYPIYESTVLPGKDWPWFASLTTRKRSITICKVCVSFHL